MTYALAALAGMFGMKFCVGDDDFRIGAGILAVICIASATIVYTAETTCNNPSSAITTEQP